MHKWLRFASSSPPFGPPITSPNHTIIFGNLIDKTQLVGIKLGHASNELCTQSLILFDSDALQVFLAYSNTDKFIMYHRVVY